MLDFIRSFEEMWGVLCSELQPPGVVRDGYIERGIYVQEGRCQRGVLSNL